MPLARVESTIARSLRQAGDAGRRVTVVGTARNVGTTYAAITLGPRAGARGQCGAGRSRVRRAKSVGDLDRSERARHCRTGRAARPRSATSSRATSIRACISSRPAMSAATPPRLPPRRCWRRSIEALAQSYDHVVIDIGSAAEMCRSSALRRWRTRAVLVAADPASAATRAVRDRLMHAGFGEVTAARGRRASRSRPEPLRSPAQAENPRASGAPCARPTTEQGCCLMARLPVGGGRCNASARSGRRR